MPPQDSLYERMEQEKLARFTAFWETLIGAHCAMLKRAAAQWTDLHTMFVDCDFVIDALRNAGAYVHIHGFTGESGEFGFEVTNWREFNRGVFAIMGVADPQADIDVLNKSSEVPF